MSNHDIVIRLHSRMFQQLQRFSMSYLISTGWSWGVSRWREKYEQREAVWIANAERCRRDLEHLIADYRKTDVEALPWTERVYREKRFKGAVWILEHWDEHPKEPIRYQGSAVRGTLDARGAFLDTVSGYTETAGQSEESE